MQDSRLHKKSDFLVTFCAKPIVEIKKSGYDFQDSDWDRLFNYIDAFEEFFKANIYLDKEFPNDWIINLIADGVDIKDRQKNALYISEVGKNRIVRSPWIEFLDRTKRAHEEFLNINDKNNLPA